MSIAISGNRTRFRCGSATHSPESRIIRGDIVTTSVVFTMVKFLLWLLLLFFCWPLALVALVLYPIIWLLMLPFRIVGIAVDGVFQFLKAIIMLPARILRGSAAR